MDKCKDNLYDKRYILAIVLSSIALFLCVWKKMFIVTNIMAWDEIGYWSNAAYLVGLDWSSVASKFSSYYSYGYSVIIAIILLICKNATLAYQIAIGLNCLMLVANLIFLIKLGNVLTHGKEKWKVMCCALIAAFYTNNLAQSFNAWPECELILLFTIIFYLSVKIQKKYSLIKAVLLTILVCYLYCVHNRTLAFVIAGCIVLFFSLILKKISIRDFVVICIVICCALSFILYMKNVIINGVYSQLGDRNLGNNVKTIVSQSYNNFLNINGIVDLVETFCNRFYYWGVTTYGTFFAVIFFYVKHFINVIRGKENISFDKSFIALSVLGTVVIITIALSNHHDYQSLLYGRYQDFMTSPLYMCGMLLVLNRLENKYMPVYIILVIVLYYVAKAMPIYIDYFVVNCNTTLYKYWMGTSNGGYNLELATKVAVLIGFLIYYISVTKRKNVTMFFLIVYTIISCCASVIDYNNVFNNLYNNYYGVTNDLKRIHSICENYDKVYLVSDEAVSMSQPIAMWIQIEMYDHKVIVVDKNDSIPTDSYIIYPRKKEENRYIINTKKQGRFIMGDTFVGLYYKGEKYE